MKTGERTVASPEEDLGSLADIRAAAGIPVGTPAGRVAAHSTVDSGDRAVRRSGHEPTCTAPLEPLTILPAGTCLVATETRQYRVFRDGRAPLTTCCVGVDG